MMWSKLHGCIRTGQRQSFSSWNHDLKTNQIWRRRLTRVCHCRHCKCIEIFHTAKINKWDLPQSQTTIWRRRSPLQEMTKCRTEHTVKKRADRGDPVQSRHGEGVVALILAHMAWLPCYLLICGCDDEVCTDHSSWYDDSPWMTARACCQCWRWLLTSVWGCMECMGYEWQYAQHMSGVHTAQKQNRRQCELCCKMQSTKHYNLPAMLVGMQFSHKQTDPWKNACNKLVARTGFLVMADRWDMAGTCAGLHVQTSCTAWAYSPAVFMAMRSAVNWHPKW